jgi:hypothetical protein
VSDPTSRNTAVVQLSFASLRSASGPAIHQVQSCDDMGLRQAITSAADGDTIAMPMGCSVITLTAGAIPIMVDNLNLVGPGAAAFTIDGGGGSGFYNRVFRHYGAGTLAISGITIADASVLNSVEPNGGCIDSDGTVVLAQSTVTACYLQAASGLTAQGGAIYGKLGVTLYSSTVSSSEVHALAGFTAGGGLFSNGYLYLSGSTVSDNLAAEPGFGGGAYSIHGDVQIKASTISGNRAGLTGGGLFVGYLGGPTAVAYITDSTISGNYASGYVGGVALHIPATISNSTIVSNRSVETGTGVGVYAATTFVATSSIFASNLTPAGDLGMDVLAPTGIGGEKNIIVLTPSTAPADTITSCPHLGPLADNGGPTWTHALLQGSPAIDAGENTLTLEFDQRMDGFPRTFGATTDIGAYEWQGDLQDEIFSSGFESACD